MQFLKRALQVADKHVKPQYTPAIMAERQSLEQGIAEKKAKLETFRTQEVEFRALLVAAYASMAYEAERCKFKLETRQWKDGATLRSEYERVEEAIEAHTKCLEEITYLERSIEEDQGELDDAELWQGVR